MTNPKIPQKTPIIEEIKAGTYWWCSCGKSTTQPYCDGSHQRTEFTPLQIDILENNKVAWCACKHSNNKPFCDGIHKTL